jgi:hypothetical protein
MRIAKNVILIILLVSHFTLSEDLSYRQFWWQIQLEIEVEGEYKFQENGRACSGNFQIRLICNGGMERDNGDYIYYQMDNNIADPLWVEYITVKDSQKGHFSDISKSVKPEIKINYVVRKSFDVHVDFEISSIPVPYTHFDSFTSVVLPRSRENSTVNKHEHYNRWIRKGANKISFPEKLIYKQNKIDRDFQWNWERNTHQSNESHKVTAKLTVTRQLKTGSERI